MVDYALLLIDVHQAFSERDASDDNRSCPQAEQNIARLLGLFRKLDHTVIHIHHNSLEIDSAFSVGCTGGNLQEFAKPNSCLLYTSPSPRDLSTSRMPSSA